METKGLEVVPIAIPIHLPQNFPQITQHYRASATRHRTSQKACKAERFIIYFQPNTNTYGRWSIWKMRWRYL